MVFRYSFSKGLKELTEHWNTKSMKYGMVHVYMCVCVCVWSMVLYANLKNKSIA